MRSGQRIGKYVLGEQIARGGMAEVWAARVEGPGGFVKPLALKFILESFACDAELERLFVNEARLAARLQHANLVTVFDFDRMTDSDAGPGGRYYIAMERVDGHDLRRVVQAAAIRGRRLPARLALYVAGEVLRGLQYVHGRRDEPGGRPLELVHRDVSPHNVLIGMGGEVKLSDFGIAKARALTPTVHTRAGTVRGKLAYAAPEQLRGETVDHRADQFALGIVLWEMLAGRRLFDGSSEMEIADKVLRGEIPRLPAAAGVDPAIERIAGRMLSAQARDRFRSTAEALSAVMAAPGYRPDPAPLVELMQELFTSDKLPAPLAPTAPLDLPDAPGSGVAAGRREREMPPTLPLELVELAVATTGALPRQEPPRKKAMAPTRPMEIGPAASADGVSPSEQRPLDAQAPDTDSGSYVSDVAASPWARLARRPRQPPRRLVVAFVAVALGGGGAGVAIRRLAASRATATSVTTGRTAPERGPAAAPVVGDDDRRSPVPDQPTRPTLPGSSTLLSSLPSPTSLPEPPPRPSPSPRPPEPERDEASPLLPPPAPEKGSSRPPLAPPVSGAPEHRSTQVAVPARGPMRAPPAPMAPPVPLPATSQVPETTTTPPPWLPPPASAAPSVETGRPPQPAPGARGRRGHAPNAAPILE